MSDQRATSRGFILSAFLATGAFCAAAVAYPVHAVAQGNAVDFRIGPGTLDQALASFGVASGISVFYDAALTETARTDGVRGTLPPEDALRQLLDGTGFSYRFTASGGVTVERISQSAEEQNGAYVMDSILVQGELLTRTVQDSQTSAFIETGEELERRSDVDLRTVATRAANVTTSARGVGFVFRGIDERGVSGNADGSAATVTISIDGARISNFGRKGTTFLPTWDLEQVEFLRGPQSTQTGRNALAGAVVVRTKDPTYEQEVKVRAGAGNGRAFQGAFAFNQPIIDDMLAVRLTGDLNVSDGFVSNPTLNVDDEAEIDNFNLRGSIRFDPTEDISAILKLSYLDSTDGFASSDPDFFPERITLTNEETQDSGQYRSANLRIGYDISDMLRLESETTFIDRDFQFRGDIGGAADDGFLGDDNPGQSFEQELRLFYTNDRVDAVVGGFFADIRNEGNRFGTFPSSAFLPGLPDFTVTGLSESETDITNFAFFGEVEVELLDDLRLIAGGRYDRETQDVRTVNTTVLSNPIFAPLLPPDTTEETSTTFDAFLPKAGIVYDFTKDLSLGFTYQRGYRSGGANFNFLIAEQNDFDPEFTNNYELALRSQWLDGRLTANANAFYIDWTNQQVQVFGPSGNPLDVRTENAGESHLFGGELELSATPLDGLDLYASIGYVETEFDDFVSGGVQLAGNEFRNAPKWTGSVGGTYFFENGLYLGADATYTSGSFGDAENTPEFRADSRFLLDLRAGYETENFNVFAYVNNVFDNTYAEERFAQSVTIGDPLTFGLVAQLAF